MCHQNQQTSRNEAALRSSSCSAARLCTHAMWTRRTRRHVPPPRLWALRAGAGDLPDLAKARRKQGATKVQARRMQGPSRPSQTSGTRAARARLPPKVTAVSVTSASFEPRFSSSLRPLSALSPGDPTSPVVIPDALIGMLGVHLRAAVLTSARETVAAQAAHPVPSIPHFDIQRDDGTCPSYSSRPSLPRLPILLVQTGAGPLADWCSPCIVLCNEREAARIQ